MPLPLQAVLRDAGPVVYLNRYDVFGTAGYERVHAALSDWQSFESGTGVGLSNFRKEKPWRPLSLLLEADPPGHDAPRDVLTKILNPRALRTLREVWFAEAEALVDEVLTETACDAVSALARAFPLRFFPDAVGLGREGRQNLLPYGDHAFNAFGPHNDLVAKGEARVAFDEAVRWESPVQTFFRTANRDPRRWGPSADAFDLSRDPSAHVGFGMGIHQCIGQHVARLEAGALLAALAARVARIEPTAPPVRHLNNTLRSWESIPVRLHPA